MCASASYEQNNSGFRLDGIDLRRQISYRVSASPTRKGRRPCKVSTRFDGLRRPGYCITCCSIRRHESQGYCHRSDTITPVLMRFGVSGVGLELFSFTPPPLPDNGIKVTVGSMVSDLRFVPTLSRRDRVWRATE